MDFAKAGKEPLSKLSDSKAVDLAAVLLPRPNGENGQGRLICAGRYKRLGLNTVPKIRL